MSSYAGNFTAPASSSNYCAASTIFILSDHASAVAELAINKSLSISRTKS